jgi:hypothetical protein
LCFAVPVMSGYLKFHFGTISAVKPTNSFALPCETVRICGLDSAGSG